MFYDQNPHQSGPWTICWIQNNWTEIQDEVLEIKKLVKNTCEWGDWSCVLILSIWDISLGAQRSRQNHQTGSKIYLKCRDKEVVSSLHSPCVILVSCIQYIILYNFEWFVSHTSQPVFTDTGNNFSLILAVFRDLSEKSKKVTWWRIIRNCTVNCLEKKGMLRVGGNHTSHIVDNHGSPFC